MLDKDLYFVKPADFLFLCSTLAEVHRPGCSESCGRASWNQRASLFWPDSS